MFNNNPCAVIGVVNFELAQDGSMQSLATQWVDTSVEVKQLLSIILLSLFFTFFFVSGVVFLVFLVF